MGDFKTILKTYGFQVTSVMIATLGMVSDGMQFGWPSGTLSRMKTQGEAYYKIVPTQPQADEITMCYMYGQFLSVMVSLIVFTFVTRKQAVMIACTPIVLSWFFIAIAPSAGVIMVGRIFGGSGKNMVYSSVPMYIGEIAVPKIRGTLGNFMYTCLNIGVLLSNSLVPFTPFLTAPLVALTLVTIQMILFMFMPDSPYYLIQIGKDEKAQNVLKRLRGSDDIAEEFGKIKAAVERQMAAKKNWYDPYKRLFTVKANLKALGIIMFLRFAQMFSAITVFTQQIHQIFAAVEGSVLSKEVVSIIYSFMMITSTLLSMAVTDLFGRRTLLLSSCCFALVSLIGMGTYFYLQTNNADSVKGMGWLPMFCLVLYVYGYRVGLGTVPLIVVTEIFAADIKAPGTVIADLGLAIGNIGANKTFQLLRDAVGLYFCFWFFGGCCVVCFIVSWFILPETRGKTLEEIQLMLLGIKEGDPVPKQ